MHPSEADLALLQRYSRRRDEDAFAEIVRRYAAVVYATCHRILGDRARAEEASQETFFRLVQKPEAVTRSLGGWLHRAATQLAIDTVRRDAARRKRELKVARAQPRRLSRWEELSPLIDEALAELPEETRTLLVRHFLQGTPQTALAIEHLTSTATISRRIAAGLQALRTRLRSRGVVVAAAALTGLFGQATAHAAPPALLAELGKMALISGAQPVTTAAAATVPATLSAKIVSAAVVALVLAAIGLLLIALVALFTSGQPDPQPTPANEPVAVDALDSTAGGRASPLPSAATLRPSGPWPFGPSALQPPAHPNR